MIHVDEVASEVISEAPSTLPEPAQNLPWRDAELMREMQALILRNRRRTNAEGFDD